MTGNILCMDNLNQEIEALGGVVSRLRRKEK